MFYILLIFLCLLPFHDADKFQRIYEKAIISAQGITSFRACQTKARLINAALQSNLHLHNIPNEPVSQENVTFWLYTRKNLHNPEPLNTYNPRKMITSSRCYNDSLPLVLYVHGYNQFWNESAKILTSKLLSKENINLIIVDWDSYTFFDLDYTRNNTTPNLGIVVAQFGNQLMKRGINAKNVFFIGFSVGGEVIGLAGKNIRPKIGKILAIDPQGSCFNYLPPSHRLNGSDAEFVQIMHCTVGERALPLNVHGHVTFYLNGGLIQPQCTNDTVTDITLCSHKACDGYFFDSISNPNLYIGSKCDTQLQYLFDECDNNDVSIMGYYTSIGSRGPYYVDTISYKPLN